MAQPTIQHSFNSGEWAPNLWARTDIAKYASGAALLRNFFVDYRGGISTRVGTKYILRGYKDSTDIRLIPFQASFAVKYAMEFGDQYIRFYANGSPVLETGVAITGVTRANPCVVSVTNTWSVGDWVYITGVAGMTQLNGNYYIIAARTGGSITLNDLFGNAVDSSAYTAWASGGTAARIYTLTSPYAAADLPTLKFSQNINTMVFTHVNYVPYTLTYAAPTSWTLAAIVFGSAASAPTNAVATTTLGGGSVNYGYVVTSMDGTGQESLISSPALLANKADLRTVVGTNTISWDAQAGASSYNIYKAIVSYAGPISAGASYGYIGNTQATNFADTNITADYSQPPPTYSNPFATGSKVTAVTPVIVGSYTTAPSMTFTAAPPGGITATGTPLMSVITATVSAGGSGYVVGNTITLANGVILTVATLSSSAVATVTITAAGSTGTIPANPAAQVSTSGVGVSATFTLAWGLLSATITNAGAGYLATPTITFSAGAATATAVLGPASVGNPAVSAFFQQRLALAAPTSNPQTIYFSQPGGYYNFNVSTPTLDDNAITSSIVSGQLNNIKYMIPQPTGLITLTDGGSFLINGGSLGSAITPASITANAQSFLGCNDMPPIVVNYDILYAQSKGSSVRDASYNFYAQVFTGADISVIASHLFFGYQLLEWAWAEEPYKVVWAVRNDGTLLSLTFVKEQEFIGWAHHDTDGGEFNSVCTLVESATTGYQNFVYHIIQRTVNSQTVQYIEQFPERATTGLVKDYWTVDAGLQYSGAPATTFSGCQHLSGLTCTGLADGVIIPAFVMPYNGSFTLTTPASLVTVGLAVLAQAQSLYLDLGNPTAQSKDKKIPRVTLRVTETLGLTIGSDSTNQVAMKDLVRGNVGQNTNKVVTDLVTGDATTTIDPKWQEPGQIFFQQPYPYPASVLGLILDVAVGDTDK